MVKRRPPTSQLFPGLVIAILYKFYFRENFSINRNFRINPSFSEFPPPSHWQEEEARELQEILDELRRVREEERRRDPDSDPTGAAIGRAAFGVSVLSFPVAVAVFLLYAFWHI